MESTQLNAHEFTEALSVLLDVLTDDLAEYPEIDRASEFLIDKATVVGQHSQALLVKYKNKAFAITVMEV